MKRIFIFGAISFVLLGLLLSGWTTGQVAKIRPTPAPGDTVQDVLNALNSAQTYRHSTNLGTKSCNQICEENYGNTCILALLQRKIEQDNLIWKDQYAAECNGAYSPSNGDILNCWCASP